MVGRNNQLTETFTSTLIHRHKNTKIRSGWIQAALPWYCCIILPHTCTPPLLVFYTHTHTTFLLRSHEQKELVLVKITEMYASHTQRNHHCSSGYVYSATPITQLRPSDSTPKHLSCAYHIPYSTYHIPLQI